MLTCPFKQMPDPAHETDKKREFFGGNRIIIPNWALFRPALSGQFPETDSTNQLKRADVSPHSSKEIPKMLRQISDHPEKREFWVFFHSGTSRPEMLKKESFPWESLLHTKNKFQNPIPLHNSTQRSNSQRSGYTKCHFDSAWQALQHPGFLRCLLLRFRCRLRRL